MPPTNSTTERLRQIHRLQAELTSSPHSHDLLEIVLAVATSGDISRQDDTALLWLLIVGAPSSDKTRTVLHLQGARGKDRGQVECVDTLTPAAFVSGYKDEKTGTTAPSLLARIDQGCLVVKDLTTLFSLTPAVVRKLLGDFQSLYDGEYRKATGTVGIQGGLVSFSFLGCITPTALERHHRYIGQIGPRFLIYLVPSLTAVERRQGFALTWGVRERKEKLTLLRKLVAEHVLEVSALPVPAGETPTQQATINRLALLVSRGRGAVTYRRATVYNEERGRSVQRQEVETVQIEEPFRAVQQLRNLGRALARIHGHPTVTAHELELVRRVALSSMPTDRAKTLGLLQGCGGRLTWETTAQGLKKGDSRAIQLLEELRALEILDLESTEPRVYVPCADFADFLAQPVEVLLHEAEREDEGRGSPPIPKPILLAEPAACPASGSSSSLPSAPFSGTTSSPDAEGAILQLLSLAGSVRPFALSADLARKGIASEVITCALATLQQAGQIQSVAGYWQLAPDTPLKLAEARR